MNKKQLFNIILLMFGTMIWGSAFIFQDLGMLYVEPLTFNVFRCIACSIFLAIVSLVLHKVKIKKNYVSPNYKTKDLIVGGLALGLLLAGAMGTQQIGISLESAGRSGFITSLYVIFVPIIGIVFRKKVNPFILIALVFSLTGLYLINVTDGEFYFSEGTWWLLACAILYALHILVIDLFSNRCDSIKLTAMQFFVAGLIQIPFMFIFETPVLENIINALVPILYCGVMSSGIAFAIQIYTQKNIHPTVASMVMSLESVFAIICAAIFLEETYSFIEITGCITIFISVIIATLPYEKIKNRNRN